MNKNLNSSAKLIKWTECLEIVFVLLLLCILAVCVIAYQTGVNDRKRNIHNDVAGEVLAGQAIISQRTLLPLWYHGSEPQSFLTRPTLLYTFFGWLIGDMRWGFLVGLNISLAIVVGTYVFLMRTARVHWCSALLGVIPLFLLPSSTTNNFWYAYAFYVAGMFLTLTLYIRLGDLSSGKFVRFSDKVGAVLLLGFAFAAGLTSLRLSLLLYLPLLLMASTKAFQLRGIISLRQFFPRMADRWVLLLGICNLLGQVTKRIMVSNGLLLGGNWSPAFCPISEMIQKLLRMPASVLALVGIPNRNIQPISFEGAALIVSFALICMFGWTLKSRIRLNEEQSHTMAWVGLSFAATLFFGTFSTLPLISRYFYVFLLLAAFATSIAHNYWRNSGQYLPRICVVMAWSVMVITVSIPEAKPTFEALLTGVRIPLQARVIEDYMKRNGVSRAYATYDNSIINTFFPNGRVDVAPLCHIVNQRNTRPRPYHYQTKPESFTYEFLNTNVMVFLSEEEEKVVQKDHPDFFDDSIPLGNVGDVISTGWSAGSPIKAFLFPKYNPFVQ